VQADVDEVGGQVLEERPATGGIGDDEGDAMAAQQGDEGRVDEARVADLDRVAERPDVVDLEPGAAVEALVVAACERERRAAVARQQSEEGGEALGVEAELRRELPQDRAELVAQAQHPEAKKLASGVPTFFSFSMWVM
jgi:hypothetical protein